MNFKKAVDKVNKIAKDHEMRYFQEQRKIIKGLKKRATKDIFGKVSTKLRKDEEDKHPYAYHTGGRKELQFNMAYEKDEPWFRYGIAFSLHRDQTLQDPLGHMKEKIEKYNDYISENSSRFSDIDLYTHGKNRKKQPSLQIENDMIKRRAFIFIGKYKNKELEDFDDEDFKDILSLFDRLLALYLHVERNNNIGNNDSLIFEDGRHSTKYETIRRNTREESKVKLKHNKIVNNTLDYLRNIHDQQNVKTEVFRDVGGQIDIAISEDDSYIFYEIKTSDNIKYCIRRALGQLIEYCYYPSEKVAKKLVIVSPNKIDRDCKEYLEHLRNELNIPVYYQRYDEENGELSNRLF